jgi:outer membrane receptor protein involved in Fe transport
MSLLALLLCGFPDSARAQRNTATFAGIVVDTSGAVLPGADVALVSEGTSIVERQVTSATGEFVFNYVPGGSYKLTISIPGFKTYTAQGISLGAAQNVRRTFQLEVGALEESVTVSGEAPLINTASPEQRINLEPREVSTLPTANRNITNLLSIGAGLTKQEGIEGGNAARRIRLNGLGGSSTSITANGTDASGNAGSRQLSQYNSISKIDVVSIEAVGEVQIVKGVVPAEYGQALAGNLNIITKAGSNAWQGSLFERYEGSVLSAKPKLLRSKPDSTWNQYGGSFGGPIARDRAFFFGAFEGYRQTTSISLNANVPTQRFRDLALAALPFEETKLFLGQFPAPTEPVAANALAGTFIGPGDRENRDEHVDFRTDVRLGTGNLSATFTGGHPYLAQASVLPGRPRVWKSLTRRASANYALARGRWSSETRFGTSYNWLSRTDPYFNVVDPSKPIETSRDQHRGVARLGFPGITNPEGEQHVRGTVPSYTLAQQITIVTDRHAVKFGGLYNLFRGGRWNYAAPTLTFDTLDDLLANRPRISMSFPSPESTWATTNFGFFVQDDWRVNPKLVINVGVRYDYFGRYRISGADPNVPASIVNLDGLLDANFNFGPLRPLDRIYEDDKGLNLGPRAGFAYNIDGRGRTVLNGGWGMMFQPFDTQNFEPSISNIKLPRAQSYTVQEAAARGLRWPLYSNDLAQQLLGQNLPPIVGILIDPHLQSPYAMVFSVGLQRALNSSLVTEVAYVGTRGYKFGMSRTYNEADRVTGIRPNPNLSGEAYHDNSQRTTYHSLQTSLRQRMWHHITFNLNYTLSRNMAHTGGDGTPGFIGDSVGSVQDFFDLESAWGPSSGDVTHLFIGSAIYEMSADRWSSALAKHLLGGWQFSGIFRASSGLPLLITQSSARGGSRPDVVDAENAVNRGSLQYLNRDAFALVPVGAVSRQTIRAGNVGNGQFRGPRSRNLDFSVARAFPLAGRTRLELRSDMLNVLNLTNHTSIQNNITAVNFGQVTGFADSRIVQVQARLSF